MKRRTIFLMIALGFSLIATILSRVELNRQKLPPPQPDVERNMLGWPVREVTPAERERNLERALSALRQVTAEHETKVADLRERLSSATDPNTAAAELAHQEKILAALQKRLEEEENANQ